MACLTSDRKILLVLLALTIIRGLIYIAVVPPWLAPDESTHFEAIRLIGQEDLWPTHQVYRSTPMHPEMPASFEKFRVWQISGLTVPAGRRNPGNPAADSYVDYYPAHNSGSAVVAGNYPLFYHLVLSPLAGWLKPLSIDAQLYFLRLTSLLLTTLTVTAGWFMTRAIFPRFAAYAVAVASFLIFLPMHLYINTALNTDVWATVLTAFYFLAMVKIFCGASGRIWLIVTFVFGLAAIMAKPTTLFIAPTSVAALGLYAARRWNWRRTWRGVMVAGLVVAVAAGSVLFFQWTAGGRGVATLSFSTDAVDWPPTYISRESLSTYLYTVRWGFLSFWGLFGWANIAISTAWTRFWWGLTSFVGLGLVWFFIRQIFSNRANSRLTAGQRDILTVLLLAVIFALIGVYTPIVATQSSRWGPPSRYLFPALLPIALLFFTGFKQLFPARLKRYVLPAWLILFVVFDSAVLFGRLIPFIYG